MFCLNEPNDLGSLLVMLNEVQDMQVHCTDAISFTTLSLSTLLCTALNWAAIHYSTNKYTALRCTEKFNSFFK